jgi:hypothetical protein
MAGIAMMFGGALVNAFAFTGSGYLFKALDKNGYEKEMKRHNLAQEKLQKETSKWEEQRKQVIDFVNLQLKREHNSAIDFRNVDASLTIYSELHPEYKIKINKKPELRDFYNPSQEFIVFMDHFRCFWCRFNRV